MSQNNHIDQPWSLDDGENLPRQRRAPIKPEVAAERLEQLGYTIRRSAAGIVADDGGENLKVFN